MKFFIFIFAVFGKKLLFVFNMAALRYFQLPKMCTFLLFACFVLAICMSAKFHTARLNGYGLQVFDSHNGGRPPSCVFKIWKPLFTRNPYGSILNCGNMLILTFRIVCGPNLHAHAKFRRDQTNRCRYIVNFQFPICDAEVVSSFVPLWSLRMHAHFAAVQTMTVLMFLPS